MLPDAKRYWREIVGDLHEIGLFTKIDRGALAALCESYGRWVQANRVLNKLAKKDPLTEGLLMKTKNGNAIQNLVIGIANKAHNDYVRYCAEFGMTPSARSRINADPPRASTDPSEGYF